MMKNISNKGCSFPGYPSDVSFVRGCALFGSLSTWSVVAMPLPFHYVFLFPPQCMPPFNESILLFDSSWLPTLTSGDRVKYDIC